MSSLSNLKSSDLEPLFPSVPDPSVSPLQVLILNNTGIGDDAAPFIGTCEELETLGVASTKFTSAVTVRSLAIYVGSDNHLSGRHLCHHRVVQEAPQLGCHELQADPHPRPPAHFRGRSISRYISFPPDAPDRYGRNPKNDAASQKIRDTRLVDEMRQSLLKNGLH